MRPLATALLLTIAASANRARTEDVAKIDETLPIRGLCIAAPSPKRLEEFVKFIDEELAPRRVNTLILRVDYNNQYASRPELGSAGGLSMAAK